ncbi:MAG: ATP-binding protein [Chloroflexota bacterium]
MRRRARRRSPRDCSPSAASRRWPARVIEPASGIAALESLLRRLIGEAIELRLMLASDTGRVRVDPGQLDQILVNLVVNARDAMPDGGRITVETANVVFDDEYAAGHFNVKPGEFVMIAVSDTGVGMDAETRSRVFDRSSPPRSSGAGPASAWRRRTASSSRRAGTSGSTRSRVAGPRSSCTSRAWTRRPRPPLPGTAA